MKVLKKKYKKIKIKNTHKPIVKPIKITKKLGRWCNCYEGRLPYPIECQTNKASAKNYLFKDGKKTILHDRSICIKCKRQVEFIPWKNGEWDKIKEAILNGEDLRDMFPPFKEID